MVGTQQPALPSDARDFPGKVRLLFKADGVILGEHVALALERRGVPLSFGLQDEGDLDPRPVSVTLVIWSPESRASAEILLACDNARAARTLVALGLPACAPDGVNDYRPIDLAGWHGADDDPRWHAVLAEIWRAAGIMPGDGDNRARKTDAVVMTFAAGKADLSAPGLMSSNPFRESMKAFGAGRKAVSPLNRKLKAFSGTPSAIALGAGAIASLIVASAGFFFAGLVTNQTPAAQELAVSVESEAPAPLGASGGNAPEVPMEQDGPTAESGSVSTAAFDGSTDKSIGPGAKARANNGTAGAVAGQAIGAGRSPVTFRDCDICPEMLAVPAGTGLMGSPVSEATRTSDEKTQVLIDIPKPFAIGAFEVTFAEWDACVADGGCGNYRPSDVGWGRGKRPVVHVSHEDAQNYAAWLSKKTNSTYRLPTETEWEYAARAGSAGPFWFDGPLSVDTVNYHGTYPYNGPAGEYRGQTVEVGSFPANPFGLHDVHGNVWEWTSDCWSNNEPGVDCSKRIIKGGAWRSGGWRTRAAYRQGELTAQRNLGIGFRIVRDL